MTIFFTHLITGKDVAVRKADAISAVISGEEASTKSNAVWLVIDNTPSPIPVRETEEEVYTKLGISKTTEEK